MLMTLFGIFLILHGLVHLLYAGQSWQLFELSSGLTWPDGSWLFSRLVGDETTRLLATVFLVIAALGLVTSGFGLFFRADWWRTLTVASAVFSSLLYLVMWNGQFQRLPDQGGVGILINLAILTLILVFKWPA
jgi:hypothetical protein